MCDEEIKIQYKEDEMTTVIRVKRKRDSEPAEALLLAARKKLKTGPVSVSSSYADLIDIEEKVFRFAATVEPDVAHHQGIVADKVKDAILDRTEQKELLRSLRKRKLPSSKLPKLKQLKNATFSVCQSIFQDKCLKSSSDEKQTKDSQRQIGDHSLPKIQDCDKCFVYHQDNHVPRAKKSEDTIDEIMCNNTRMFREKLNLSSDPMKKTDDCVYDLYYCRNTNANWDMSELLYIQPYRYTEEDLLNYSESEDEYYEDDDDSNDEGNWRNDYPDEDDDNSSQTSSSSDSERERFIEQEEEEEEEDDEVDNQDDNDDIGLGAMDDMTNIAPVNDDVEAEAYYDPGPDNNDLGRDDNY